MGLRPLSPLLQADGELSRRGPRRRLPRSQRTADPRAGAGQEPAVRRVLRSGAAGRVPADGRRQRLPAGGVRAVRPQRASRAATVGGPRLPPSRVEPSEPRDPHPGHGEPGPVRRDPRRRRGLRPRARAEPPRPRRRGDPLRRRVQHAPDAAAVGRRQRGRARGPRHPGGAGSPRRGRASPGPPGGLRAARVHATGLGGAGAEELAQALHRRRVAVLPIRPRRDQSLRGRGLRAEQRGRRLSEPDVPFPADRDPLRRLGAGRRPRLPGAHRTDVLRRPRVREGREHRPAGPSGDPVQLPVHRPGPP